MKLTLYHGTDARMILMSPEERSQYIGVLNSVIDYLWGFYRPIYKNQVPIEFNLPDGTKGTMSGSEFKLYKKSFEEKGLGNMYINILEKLMMLDARDNGSGNYQYGSLYLTGSKFTASRYANRSFAGGETGLIAYRLMEGLDIMNFKDFAPDEEMLRRIEIFKDFSQEGKEQPVVITIEGIEPEYLLLEDGRPIDWNVFTPELVMRSMHVRCTKDITLDLKNAEYLKTGPK